MSADQILNKYLPKVSDMYKAQKAGKPYRPEMSLRGKGGVFNPVNMGLYSYARNNPIVYTDPDGNANVELITDTEFTPILQKAADKARSEAGNQDEAAYMSNNIIGKTFHGKMSKHLSDFATDMDELGPMLDKAKHIGTIGGNNDNTVVINPDVIHKNLSVTYKNKTGKHVNWSLTTAIGVNKNNEHVLSININIGL